VRYDAGRDGQPERLCFSVELSEEHSSLSRYRSYFSASAVAELLPLDRELKAVQPAHYDVLLGGR